jgi:hypothetical protein
MISVAAKPQAGGWSCDVAVSVGGRSTTHQVFVSDADLERWGGQEGVERLVERSFEFLLAREAPTAILPRFRLEEIQRYFPEYSTQMTEPSQLDGEGGP